MRRTGTGAGGPSVRLVNIGLQGYPIRALSLCVCVDCGATEKKIEKEERLEGKRGTAEVEIGEVLGLMLMMLML